MYKNVNLADSRVGRTESGLDELNEIGLESTSNSYYVEENWSILRITMHLNENCLAAFMKQRKDRKLSTECAFMDQIRKESNS